MNKELKLKSVTQKKKPSYKHGDAHKKFANILNQDIMMVIIVNWYPIKVKSPKLKDGEMEEAHNMNLP